MDAAAAAWAQGQFMMQPQQQQAQQQQLMMQQRQMMAQQQQVRRPCARAALGLTNLPDPSGAIRLGLTCLPAVDR